MPYTHSISSALSYTPLHAPNSLTPLSYAPPSYTSLSYTPHTYILLTRALSISPPLTHTRHLQLATLTTLHRLLVVAHRRVELLFQE